MLLTGDTIVVVLKCLCVRNLSLRFDPDAKTVTAAYDHYGVRKVKSVSFAEIEAMFAANETVPTESSTAGPAGPSGR